ncbi:restriction endonuclease subunit S [Coraliomargarita sp. SDUM461003]|uniref:Restriction endonuclease subunit S n=1 Tax=Thalassobacterium maritimum TaxID=3041265 RepID=A0ABU1AU45_9BACT|nr:restriction endonuclease subunit S [Coraliomargarita sp. SDUM461003]MDQ8207603.1 restriction endonuclease subunit S [Coraliomargarita sp. SDUM461003]
MKRIGDILTRYKVAETVKDDVTYKQVTIGTNYKGVRLRGTKLGIEIGTKNQWLVKAGQFILSRIDARNSAFGIIPDDLEGALVTNDFMAYEVNEDEVNRDFFNVFLQSPQFLEACIKASRGNTNRKRVQEEFFLNYEVNLPDIEHQRLLIQKIERAKAAMATAESEIAHQQSLLGKLKQAILQEAIQGKLTEDWRKTTPDVEPASDLLQRIQAEKASLIAVKKICKEKPLPEITPEEIPFEIPEGWKWCRLGQIIEEKPRNGISLKPVDYVTDAKTLKLSATSSGTFNGTECKYLDLEVEEDSYLWLRDGDILIQRANSLELVGTAAVYRGNEHEFIYPDLMMKCRAVFAVGTDYLHHVLTSRTTRDYFTRKATGSAGNMPKINQGTVIQTLIPLPPLAEQVAIVERVEALMTTCQALEAEIEHSRTHAADLLQAVLKEAFSN